MKTSLLRWICVLKTIWVMAGFLVVGTSLARADGKVFAPVLIPQQVEMPDQRALLAWENGVETLVIESAFVGKGTDFAWVVPLPSKPEVFPATRGTLPAAVTLMQPVVAEPLSGAWGMAYVPGVIGMLALILGWSTTGKIVRVVVILVIIAIFALVMFGITESEIVGWAAMAVGCLCALPLLRWINNATTMVEILVTLVIVVVLVGVITPTVGVVRSAAGAASSSATIAVERQQIGDYDVAIISGREGAGVTAWLEGNGFALGNEARTVASEHATAGGWFVASRVRREFAESGRSVPAPLAFRFATEKPIYPMRLTGAGATQSLKVELVICGPSEAEVPMLTTRTVAPLIHGEPETHAIYSGPKQSKGQRKISHPELTRWTKNTAVATWVRGELVPHQMQADLSVGWTNRSQAKGLLVHTVEDAWSRAALLGSIICFIGAIVVGLTIGNRRPPFKIAALVTVAALMVTGGFRILTPAIATEHLKKSPYRHELRQITMFTTMALTQLPNDATDETVQATFAKTLGDFAQDDPRFGIKIGDAPGDIMLHKLPDGRWRTWFFDGYGQPVFFPESDAKVGK
jgi:hypothetical protein